MTSREGKELRARVEALEKRVLQLAGQPVTVHHHYPPSYPPAIVPSYVGRQWTYPGIQAGAFAASPNPGFTNQSTSHNLMAQQTGGVS